MKKHQESVARGEHIFDHFTEISASMLTSQGRETTVDNSKLLSPHTLQDRVVQSFSSSISLCIQVRFLSCYQLLDYASATSLRKNGSINSKDDNVTGCDRVVTLYATTGALASTRDAPGRLGSTGLQATHPRPPSSPGRVTLSEDC